MTTAQTLALVIRREIIERGRSKAFIVSTIFTLLLLVGSLAVPTLLDKRTDRYVIGLVGDGNDALIATALSLGNTDAENDGGIEISTVTYEDLTRAEAAADEGTVDAVLVSGTELVTPGGSGIGGSSLAGLLQRAAASVELQQAIGESPEAVNEILTSEPLTVRSLDQTDPKETQARAFIAFGGLMLMYVAILSYGSWTLMGVTEEKANRVVEVLLSTLRPWQLLAGKIIGIGALGLAQFALTIVLALIGMRVTGAFEIPAIPTAAIPVLILWFVLGFALYSALFGAAGSLVSRAEDAQSASTPFTLMTIVGFFLSIQTLDNPGGALAVVTSFVPITAPFTVPVRTALGAIPPWQMGLSVGVMVVTIALIVRFAGRVYSGGLLKFGTRVKWKEAFRGAEL